jgi:hypothetical protein
MFNISQFKCGVELKNFSLKTDPHLLCPCCARERLKKSSLMRLQRLRSLYGKPIGIIEGGGYRCESYTSSEISAHHSGHAFDLAYPREDHWLLLSLAMQVGFTGIGDKNKKGRYQLHLDDAPDIPHQRPRPWKWTY